MGNGEALERQPHAVLVEGKLEGYLEDILLDYKAGEGLLRVLWAGLGYGAVDLEDHEMLATVL